MKRNQDTQLANRSIQLEEHQPEQIPVGSAVSFVADLQNQVNELQARLQELEKKNAELQDMAEMAQASLDSLPLNMCVIDDQGQILKVNQPWLQFSQSNSGTTTNSLGNANYLTVCDAVTDPAQSEAGAFASGIREVINGERTSFALVYPCNSPTSQRWFIGRVIPIVGPGPRRFAITHEDITKRILAEENLHESEIIFSSFLEHSPVYVFFKDSKIRTLRLSKNYEKLLGKPISEALGKSMYELFPPDLANSMEADDLFVLQNGQVMETVEEFDGKVFETTKFPIFINGKPQILAGFTLDITERKHAQDALRLADARYKEIVDNASEGIFQSTPDGRFLSVNPAMARIYGYSSPEEMIRLVGNDIKNRIYADPIERDMFMQILEQHDSVQDFENQNLRKDGSVIWTRTSARIIRDTNGKVQFYEGFIDDITKRKNNETQEREQRTLAEALHDTATALNSTLNFDEVLDRIVDNVGRVAHFDVVYIMLIDSDRQIAETVRFQGSQKNTYFTEILPIQFSIPETRNLYEMQQTGKPIMISDTSRYPDWIVTPSTQWIRANLSVPIKSKGETIGFLGLDSATPNVFSPKDAEHLQAFADQAALAIENARLYEDVQKLAITDPLTGVVNRRGLLQLGEREVEHALRFARPLSVVMLDLDHFKQVNDTFGHPVGDIVLCAVARCCRALLRNVDIVSRYGGEEFVLLLSETDQLDAAFIADRIRESVENLVIPFNYQKVTDQDNNNLDQPQETAETSEETIQVTISLGVVSMTAKTQNLSELIIHADQAMYAAKQAGRNRVMVGE